MTPPTTPPTTPFGLSLSFDKLRMIGIANPFGLSLSKPPRVLSLLKGLSLSKPLRVAVTLRHGAFDKLSPLLRANGWG